MDQFWYAFIPLFVAFDGMGLLPLFWGLSQRLTEPQRARAVWEAVATAALVAVGFLLVSRFILALMGLDFADIMVAGGAILLVVCLRDLLWSEEPPKGSYPSPGVVPLGVPLLAGPAVFTTLLLVRDRHGWQVALVALAANLAVVWALLRSSGWLMERLGREGAQVISKVASLILTAYGVMLIRHGVTAMTAATRL
jgi:multiple antibiotic resistance protein